MNEYFIPEIEDIRVGYRCEIKDETIWVPTILKEEDLVYFAAFNDYRKTGELKTAYLTRNQIEAEGWIYKAMFYLMDKNNNDEYLDSYNKGNQSIIYHRGNRILAIYNNESLVFKGYCSDINIFIFLTNLLK